ncbi:unnamed protein product [Larinioides sclopetarius]|uniref:Peptide chain release factor domain-containing protein n=1 Tax=Larinioides sclopetarius TaxID=280406 RepID=A0AAV2AAF7_9ARAC
MILGFNRIFFRKLKCLKITHMFNHRTFRFASQKFAEQKQNPQQLVSFEDIRLQKHLQFLSNLFMTSEKNETKEVFGHVFKLDVLRHINNLLQEIARAKEEIRELEVFISDLKELKDDLYNAALDEKQKFESKLEEMENEMLQLIIPSEVVDDKDIIIELTPGVGGQEAMLFAKDMFDMYCRYANWKGWKAEILRFDTTDLGGIRSAHVAISGHNAFKVLKFEGGVHRVQRVPKTEKAGRIHTSTMTVAVIPQPSEIDIVIHPNDIELEFKRSGGAGGQHVNTTDSCVRIYHKPSGIVTESQMERNQHRNRELAMKALRAKLYERELQTIIKETTTTRKIQIGTAARSEKVRTYNFAQDRITDHRAHITVHDVQSFLRGEDDFDYFSNMLQQWYNLQSLTEILNKYET